MAGIFISYRRDDSSGHAGRLFDHLREQFPGDERAAGVFMDVEGIAPGTDFVQAIHKAVGAADVVLAVMGPAWIDCKDDRGQRRLDDADDFVRIEITSALRLNKTVIPILVREARMPAEGELPHDLQRLARRQAVTLTDTNWESDIAQLVSKLRSLLGAGAKPPVAGVWQRLAQPIPMALVLALLAGAYVWRSVLRPGADIALTQPAQSSDVRKPAANDGEAGRQVEVRSRPDVPTSDGVLQASAGAMDFGALHMGANVAQELRITNSGNGVARLWRIGFAGEAQDDYSFERKCPEQELAPNGHCDVRVRFTPSEPGPRRAMLSVEYLGRTSPLIVKLWGAGTSKGDQVSSAARAE